MTHAIKELFFESPIGILKTSFRNKTLVASAFVDDPGDMNITNSELQQSGFLKNIKREFQEYFAGKRASFNIKYDIQNFGTKFQQAVWQELINIPYGKTLTYNAIAQNIGMPKAARAVGMACNRNPINILIPCHRVVGSNGKLTGYRGGLERKNWLLNMENCIE